MDKESARKFLYITLGITACVIALSIVLIAKKKNSKLAKLSVEPDVVSEQTDAEIDAQIKKALDSINFENIDSDKDGVPDWQENIYGLDPTSGQTYGEGTNDKILVDNLQAETQTEESALSQIAPSKTAVFSQDLYRASRGTLSEEDIKRLGDGAVESIKNMQVGKLYTVEETPYSSDFKESYATYITDIGPSIIANMVTEEELIRLSQAEDEEANRNEMANLYAKMVIIEKIMLSVKPPKSFRQTHVNMLNALEDAKIKVNNFVTESNDAIVVMASYATVQQSIATYMQEFKKGIEEFGKIYNS